MALIDGRQFLRTVHNNAQQSSVATLDIIISSLLEVHMGFNNVATVEETIEAKTWTNPRFKSLIMLLDCTVQKIPKTRTTPAEASNFAPLAKLDSLYILFDLEKEQLIFLRKTEVRVCTSYAFAPSPAWKERCQQRGSWG